MKNSLVPVALFSCFLLLNFLLISCEEEDKNTVPVAAFTITPESGTNQTMFTFDASPSTDNEDPPSSLLVRWDWENDGLFDTDFSTNKVLSYQYDLPGTYQITLEVKDSEQLGNSLTKSLTVNGMAPAVTTDTISGISAYSAVCGGEVTDDFGLNVTARGVCWSTNPDPTLAGDFTDDGNGTGRFSSQITGLSMSTTYYVRAYATNLAGTAYGNQVQLTTPYTWLCGNPLAVSHVAGEVAPVNKTVSYETVTGIPGEPAKCWISSNLGADHQAISVDDATEASAGWYWQFNRKQGYMHDGVNRTPNTAWDSEIDEDSDWLQGNDPCAIELGEGWHVPSQSEWANVNDNGGWNNWTGPWDSGLKMHASGYLNYTDGTLAMRGEGGAFWSNMQGYTYNAWYERYSSTLCGYAGTLKSLGHTLRCVKE